MSDHGVCQNCEPCLGDILAALLGMQVAVEKIGAVIGPGGRVIQGARDTSGAESINVSPAQPPGSLYLRLRRRLPLRVAAVCSSLTSASRHGVHFMHRFST